MSLKEKLKRVAPPKADTSTDYRMDFHDSPHPPPISGKKRKHDSPSDSSPKYKKIRLI